jgi:transposase
VSCAVNKRAYRALAYVMIIGTSTRFQRGKQIGTYVGMIPSEDSSAHKQRLGHISKQGNSLLRFLLVRRRKQQCGFIQTGDVGTCT